MTKQKIPRDPVIEFAQERFGFEAGFGPEGPIDQFLPDWLFGRVLDWPEDTFRSEDEDTIVVIEGDVPDQTPDLLAPGTTVDDLAYYLPFHFYRNRWGIYIRASGVWSLSNHIASGPIETTDMQAAYLLLLEHERLHFIAEYAASRVEIITAQSSYKEYFHNAIASENEEALANARAVRELKRKYPQLVQPIKNWMRKQPAGYRDFEQCIPPRFVDAERRLAAFMMTPTAVANRLIYGSHPAEFLFRFPPLRTVPIYWVFDTPIDWIRLVKPFPKEFGIHVLVHSNDHKPPHIHIQAPPGNDYTRYRWPDLTPLDGDPLLPAKFKKGLDQYVSKHRAAIDQRIRAIPWS